MAKLIFLFICALIPNLRAECTQKFVESLFKRSIYEFSVDLLHRVAEENENHFITSPFSIWSLLTLTSLGATGTTLQELKQVLHLQKNKCYNNIYLNFANIVSHNNDSEVLVERSSNIYVDESIQIGHKFRNKVTENSISKIESISFENADAAAKVINDQVSRSTHDAIEEIVTPGDIEDVLIVITDAIYFKGSWQVPFPHENTKAGPFYNERRAQIGEASFMFLSSSFKTINLYSIKASVIELPYGDGSGYSMLVFLPHSGVHLSSVIQNIKLVTLRTIQNTFNEYSEELVDVQIPKFKITSDLANLKELLGDMGLGAMFDESQASFPLLSDVSLFVSNIVQKANIVVNEEGAVASAATEESFSFRTVPDEFVANKPFLFMIIDKKVEVPLFIGAYSKPSLF